MIKRLNFATDNGVIFDFEFRGYINKVIGKSGSGKSYFIKEVLRKKDIDIENKSFWDNVLVFNKDRKDLENIKNQKNKVILVDNTDILDMQKYIPYIKSDRNNVYMIITKALRLGITPNYVAEVTHSENIYTLKYLFSERLWFDGNSIDRE